jgi:mannitol-1-phosphate 5-dehydrogenase
MGSTSNIDTNLRALARGRAVVIGAGKIGCGYLAPVFHDAGWDVVVAARSEPVLVRMRAAGEIAMRITGGGGTRRVPVSPVLVGGPAFERAVAGADVIATAVGSAGVVALGAPLARALAARDKSRPIDVWVVENADVAAELADAVRRAAARESLPLPPVGFAGAIAFAAVTQGDWKTSPRPEFVSDTSRWLLVDGERLRLGMPRLARVGATARYGEHLRAKRYVFSAGHALTAFLGHHHGHRFVHEAAVDPRVRVIVESALHSSARAMHGDEAGQAAVAWALERYGNAELRDSVQRVARDPIRKLAPDGPLVGPATLVVEATGRAPYAFAAGIAAALAYRNPADPQSRLLGEMLAKSGVATVLADVCGLDDAHPLARAVLRMHRWWQGAGARPTWQAQLAA